MSQRGGAPKDASALGMAWMNYTMAGGKRTSGRGLSPALVPRKQVQKQIASFKNSSVNSKVGSPPERTMILSEYGKHIKKKGDAGSASGGKGTQTRLNGQLVKFTNIDLT